MSTSTNPAIEIGLYDATNTLIQVLEPGMAIDASVLSTSNLTISARVISGSALDGQVASIVLSLNDDKPRTETVEAYSSLFGNNSGTFTGGSLPKGVNTMELALYSQKNAKGQLLDTITLDFTISQPPFLNVVAASKDDLPPLPDGYTAYAVTIPDSVTAIGHAAFSETALISVTIPDSVTAIQDLAFSETALTSVTIPDSVTSIGDKAFSETALTSVTIPDSVTSIGGAAFRGTKLKSVTIPDSVTAIGDGAFADTKLTEVTLLLDDSNITIANNAFPAGVTIIREAVVDEGTYTPNDDTDEVLSFILEGTGTLAFSSPDDTPMLTVTGDASLKGGTLSFADLPTSLGTYTLIDVADGGTLSIDAAVLNQAINDVDAFDGNGYDYTLLQQGNDLILQVTAPRYLNVIAASKDDLPPLPDGYTAYAVTIPYLVTSIEGMAFSGANITSVTIPDYVTSIGDNAFAGTKLESVTIPDSVTSIGDGAFINTNLTEVTIPDSVIAIGDGAFALTNLTSVTIPNSVTSIGHYAFAHTNLTSVTIPDSVTAIGDNAFADTKLTSVEIPDSVTSIGNDAFAGTNLTSVTIPDSVTAIGDNAFPHHTNLESVTIGNSVKVIAASKDDLPPLPDGYTAYAVTIPDSVTAIKDLAFANTNLESVTIPDSVTAIGDGAFAYTKLTSVEIPDSVTAIGDKAFAGTNLKSVTIPDSVTAIGDKAFPHHTNLESVTIPDSVTAIGDKAFADTNLTEVTIGNSVKVIAASKDDLPPLPDGYTAYAVTIPDSVTAIQDLAFADTNLESVTIPDSVTAIGNGAFAGTNLKSVTIPDSVTFIGHYAFVHTDLTEVTIPDSVIAIGEGAFAHTDLTEVTIPDSVTAIWDGAFADTDLTEVTIPDSVTAIWDGAFADTDLTEVTLLLDDPNITIADNAFPAGVTIIREAVVDAGTYTLNDDTDKVATFTLEGTGTLAFSSSSPDDITMLRVTGDADLKGGTLSFADLPTVALNPILVDTKSPKSPILGESDSTSLNFEGWRLPILVDTKSPKSPILGESDSTSLNFEGWRLWYRDYYTLIDVADGGTLSIDAAVLNQAISDVDAFDGNGYDYTLLQQDNDLILRVVDYGLPRVLDMELLINLKQDDSALNAYLDSKHYDYDQANQAKADASEVTVIDIAPVDAPVDASVPTLIVSTDTSLSATTASSVIEGGLGDDILVGGDGADTLIGGDGADTLIGGGGSDTFKFTSDQGIDIIQDFTDQDRIVIDASELGGIIVNPVYDSSTGELSVTRQTFEMQITKVQIGSISVPISKSVLVEEDITLAVLENPSGFFDVSTDVSIV